MKTPVRSRRYKRKKVVKGSSFLSKIDNIPLAQVKKSLKN